jgi:hypothetical protein
VSASEAVTVSVSSPSPRSAVRRVAPLQRSAAPFTVQPVPGVRATESVTETPPEAGAIASRLASPGAATICRVVPETATVAAWAAGAPSTAIRQARKVIVVARITPAFGSGRGLCRLTSCFGPSSSPRSSPSS